MNRYRRGVLGTMIVGTLAVAGCAGVGGRDKVSVNVADLRMGTASVFEQQYFVTLRIQNPNDRELAVKGVVFDLELNGKPFARGTSGQTLAVPRFGSARVEVETLSTITSLLRQLGAVSGDDGQTRAFKYRIKGRVHQSGLGATIPFDDSGELNLGDNLGGQGK